MALVAHRASGLRHAVGAGARAADNAPAPRPDLRLLETTLAEVKAVQDSLKGHGTEFDTLLNLRARIDPLRDDLRTFVVDLDEKRAGLQARVAEIGTQAARRKETA